MPVEASQWLAHISAVVDSCFSFSYFLFVSACCVQSSGSIPSLILEKKIYQANFLFFLSGSWVFFSLVCLVFQRARNITIMRVIHDCQRSHAERIQIVWCCASCPHMVFFHFFNNEIRVCSGFLFFARRQVKIVSSWSCCWRRMKNELLQEKFS